MYNVVLNFRDRMVHRLEIGEDLQLAQSVLTELGIRRDAKESFRFKNKSSDLIFVSNLDNFQFAFIEEITETKGEKE
jgi:hypothetical protein